MWCFLSTIYDVALESGVSRSTVSRVLNGKKEVNEETRRKVMQVIKKLNFNANASARSLALQRNLTIGVVSAGLTDPFYSSIIDCIHESADEAGYGTLFCKNTPEHRTNFNYFNILYGKVDGILFVGENTVLRRDVIRLLDEAYPTVLIENDLTLPGAVCVNIDNFGGAYAAVRHLIHLGHKNIAHIMGKTGSFESQHRLNGYRQALDDYSLDCDKNLIKTGNFTFIDAYQSSKELLSERSNFDAVFCSSDLMAAGFMHAAYEKGLKIPDDVSVIGFDGIDDNSVFAKEMPGLTTVRQPRNAMAAYAVKALIHSIEKNDTLENKVFSTKLVIRNSTAPARH